MFPTSNDIRISLTMCVYCIYLKKGLTHTGTIKAFEKIAKLKLGNYWVGCRQPIRLLQTAVCTCEDCWNCFTTTLIPSKTENEYNNIASELKQWKKSTFSRKNTANIAEKGLEVEGVKMISSSLNSVIEWRIAGVNKKGIVKHYKHQSVTKSKTAFMQHTCTFE